MRTSTFDHFAALAMAGRARLALEKGDMHESVTQLIASFNQKPESGGSLEGLSQSPMETAKLLKAKLETAGEMQWIARLDAVIATLPEPAFASPEYTVASAPRAARYSAAAACAARLACSRQGG